MWLFKTKKDTCGDVVDLLNILYEKACDKSVTRQELKNKIVRLIGYVEYTRR